MQIKPLALARADEEQSQTLRGGGLWGLRGAMGHYGVLGDAWGGYGDCEGSRGLSGEPHTARPLRQGLERGQSDTWQHLAARMGRAGKGMGNKSTAKVNCHSLTKINAAMLIYTLEHVGTDV